MNYRKFYILILLGALSISSCTSIRLRTANENYELGAYSNAISDYEYVLSKRQVPAAIEQVADAYRQLGNSLKAEFWYRRAIKLPNPRLEWNLFLAESLMKNGKYEEAKVYFTKYLQLNKNDYKAQRFLNSCDSLDQYFRDTTLFTIEPMRYNKRSVNVFSPTFYRNGITFISDMPYKGLSNKKSDLTGKKYLDIFYAKKTDHGNWLDPEPLLGEVNGRFNDGSVTFSRDYNKMYFTRNNYLSNKPEKNKKNINILKIYEADFVNGVWIIRKDLNLVGDEFSYGHPTLNAEGNILFFVSNMPWGYGGTDIYYSIKKNDKWSVPVNLGLNVNSEGNEMFPFLANDSTLYFSTDGLGGLGGLDVYETKFINGLWSKPFNLGSPINSSQDDFGFIIDSTGLNGFFSSSRSGVNDKLFSFVKNPPKLVVNIKVTDQQTHKAIPNATVAIRKDGNVYSSALSDNNGFVILKVEPDHNYDFTCDNRYYYLRKASISTIGKRFSDTLSTAIELKKIELNKPFVWYGIAFKKKTVEIKPAGKEAMDLLVTLLKENPRIELQVGSYTDSKGSDADNLKLTEARAAFVVEYLISKGLAPNRFLPKGYGETKLLNKCTNGLLCIEEEHEINNRIELIITNISDISLR